MSIYLLIFIFIYFFLTSIIFNKKPKVIFILSGVILILCATFRSSYINMDTDTYINYYNTVPSFKYLFQYNNYYFEKGYVFLNMLISSLGLNYRFFLLIIATISLSFVLVTIYRYATYPFLILFIYFTNFYFLNELLIMRTGIAFSIIFFALKYLKDNKKKYILFVIIASLFHRIALIALLPIIFMKLNIISKKKFILISIIAAFFLGRIEIITFIINNFKSVLPLKILYYFINYEYTESSYRRLFLFLPIFLYFLKNFNKYKNNNLFEESMIFFYISIVTKLLFIKHEALDRISHLFLMGILFLPDIYLKSLKNKENRFFLKIGITVFFGLLLMWYLRGDNVITIIL